MVTNGTLLDYEANVSGHNTWQNAKGSVSFYIGYVTPNGELKEAWCATHFGSTKGKVTPEDKKQSIENLLDPLVGSEIKIVLKKRGQMWNPYYSLVKVSETNSFMSQINGILNGN